MAKYACVCWLQCRLEGYYDADRHIVYLHLQSAYDSVVMADLCQIAEKDVSSNVCYSVITCHVVYGIFVQWIFCWRRGAVVDCRTCNQEVVGSSLGPAHSVKTLRKFPHLCVSVTKQYNLVPAYVRWRPMAGEVTVGLAESKGSSLPGLQCACVSLWAWWEVVVAHHQVHDYACCHLLADCRVWDQLRSQHLTYEYGIYLSF